MVKTTPAMSPLSIKRMPSQSLLHQIHPFILMKVILSSHVSRKGSSLQRTRFAAQSHWRVEGPGEAAPAPQALQQTQQHQMETILASVAVGDLVSTPCLRMRKLAWVVLFVQLVGVAGLRKTHPARRGLYLCKTQMIQVLHPLGAKLLIPPLGLMQQCPLPCLKLTLIHLLQESRFALRMSRAHPKPHAHLPSKLLLSSPQCRLLMTMACLPLRA